VLAVSSRSTHEVQFAVEQAGCSSCAARIREALDAIGTVERIELDESADVAVVQLASPSRISREDVDRALEKASAGSGHQYTCQRGSWLVRLA
jgi:cation transport ATPase